ncbi:hypothetical protein FACS1894202_06700 [Clostridia bacterium]|nr:hypothetical protein FACS1894202_06700 [Clostridia bacterium]
MNGNISVEDEHQGLEGQVKELKRQVAQLERELRKSARLASHSSAIMEAKTQLSKTLEAANRMQSRYMDIIITNSPNPMVLLDGENRILLATGQLFKLTGAENHAYIKGLPLRDVAYRAFGESGAELLSALAERVLETKEPLEVNEWLDWEGTRKYYTVQLLPVSDADTVIGVLIVLFDLTDLMNEKLKADQANLAKSAFLAKMSHEIRTPMNAITGMSELILREDISSAVREYTTDVKNASANLLAIINDILDFSKIESGKMEILSSEYELASLINDAVAIIRMRLVDKAVDFIVNIDCTLPNIAVGDEVRIRQILINVLTNAVKYTSSGSIRLKVTGKRTAEDEIELGFEIADTGIGIKEEDLGELFGDFVQFDAEKNRNIEGTGLGLAITRKLCLAMGGDITVSSRYGAGSVFTVYFPQKVNDFAPIAAVKSPETKKVLIYKIPAIHAESISESLDNLRVRNKIAADDAELRAALNEAYDYIFVHSVAFEQQRRVLKEAGFKGTVVIVSAFGNFPPGDGARSIAFPVHSIAIANVLNNVATISKYTDNESVRVRFSAPSVRVLLVDDIATNLRVAEGLLAPYDMRLSTCLSGEDAIYLCKENDYDIIVMDHMMPGMDGIETTRVLREAGCDVPIIALTANAVSGMREMFLENGFDDYLAKPIEMSKLNEAMERWIPAEKRVKTGERPIAPAAAPTIHIDGVDVRRGIEMTGGEERDYLEVLALFRRDARERMPVLCAVPDGDGLPLFITQVHAIKSASASIGAAELSEQAALLESAGRRGDFAAIRGNLSGFTRELDTVLEGIRAVTAPETADAPADRELLLRLKAALEAEDIAETDRLLEQCSLPDIADFVLMGSFGEAAQAVGEIINIRALS